MSKIGASKPKKSSLIANLLNRVDGKSLAVKKSVNDGILIYWEDNTTKHLKCNKEVLGMVGYEQIEQIMEYNELFLPVSINVFKLIEHVQTIVKTEPKKKAHIVRSFKQTDKIGTNKGEKEVFNKKKSSGKPQNKK